MIGRLPRSLMVGSHEYAIRTDFRVVLTIMQAFADPDLTDREKCFVCMKCLYEDFDSIPAEDIEQAAKQAYWFVNGGDMPHSSSPVRTFDWEQDEQLIFPAVNRAAGFEVREVEYLHWWTFLGYFGTIGEGLFSEVLRLRGRLAKGKPLDKTDREFYREHRSMIDLKKRLTEEERQAEEADAAFLRELIGE